MQGVIIIDEKQYMFADVVTMSVSQSDKQFTVRLETATNQFNDSSDEDILHTLMGDEADLPIAEIPAPLMQPTIVSAETPRLASKSIRVSIEKSETSNQSDINPLILSSSPTAERKAPVVPIQNQPSVQGIIIPEKSEGVTGKRYDIGNDAALILNRTRIDLGVVVIGDSKRDVLKNVKKNAIIKSEVFTQLSDVSVRLALQTLVMKEQSSAHVYDRDDVIFIEEPVQLVVASIVDEQQGLGEFYYEEMVSVYEGVSTRTKIDNGKDAK